MHPHPHPHAFMHKFMHKKCCKSHAQGMRLFPFILLMPLTIAVASVVGLFLYKRMVVASETIAMTTALDELEAQLSDGERADLEMRIRENLFG
jgi:hypothetical protein